MKKKIYLIQTTFRKRNGILYQGKLAPFQSLALAALSATIPQDWEKEFCLEYFNEINYESDASVIGLSCMAYDLVHAIEVAEEFKKKGKKIIFGGYQPYFSKERIKHVCDSVVFGNPGPGEMKGILNDALNGKLKSEYVFGVNINFPFDYSIYKNINLQFPPVLSSIGCKNNCNYCCTAAIYKKYYMRDQKYVLDDIESICQSSKYACFVDANIYNERDYLLDLCSKIVKGKFKLSWGAQATIDIASDDEVLNSLKMAGCKLLMVGLESLSQKNMKNVRKNYNIKKYRDQIQKLRSYGIYVFGLFLLGLDDDKASDFNRLYNFIQQTGIVVAGLNILLPSPDTPIFQKLKSENRLLINEEDFIHKTYLDKEIINKCYYYPKNMSIRELEDNFMKLSGKLASFRGMIRRSLSFNIYDSLRIFGLNMGFRKQYLDLKRDYYPG